MGMKKGVILRTPFSFIKIVIFFDGRQTAEPNPNQDTGSLGVAVGDFVSRILQGKLTAHQGIMDKGILFFTSL